MTEEKRKNLGGRPAVNATPITVRVPPAMLAMVDAWAAKHGVSRPEAIRSLIQVADHFGVFED